MTKSVPIPVLYHRDRKIASLLRSPYEIRPNLRVDPSRLQPTYLALITLSGENVDVQFYRVIGRKAEAAVATPHHLEDVDSAFVDEFTAVLVKNHILRGAIQVDDAIPTALDGSQPPSRKPVQQPERPQFVPPAVPAQEPPKKKGGFLKGLFSRNKSAGKVYFAGAEAIYVIRAQERIQDVLSRAGVKKVTFEEVVTPTTLIQRIEGQSGFIVISETNKLQSDPGWREAFASLTRMGVRIVDIHELLASQQDETILAHFQDVPNIDIKAVLYTRQRRIMFLNNTGGVGKTTLSLNLAHWLATKNANAMYLEILGGAGIDDILGVQSASLENLLYGVEKIMPAKVRNVPMYFAALSDNTNSIIGDYNAWQRWFEQMVLNKEATPYLHALLVDTYTNMLSTRFLLPYMTDIVVVSDMRQTTGAMTINTMRNVIDMLPPAAPGQPKPNLCVVHNQYPVNDRDADMRLGRISSELDSVVSAVDMKVAHLVVPADPAFYGSIRVYDDATRSRLIGGLVQHLYGVKIS